MLDPSPKRAGAEVDVLALELGDDDLSAFERVGAEKGCRPVMIDAGGRHQ